MTPHNSAAGLSSEFHPGGVLLVIALISVAGTGCMSGSQDGSVTLDEPAAGDSAAHAPTGDDEGPTLDDFLLEPAEETVTPEAAVLLTGTAQQIDQTRLAVTRTILRCEQQETTVTTHVPETRTRLVDGREEAYTVQVPVVRKQTAMVAIPSIQQAELPIEECLVFQADGTRLDESEISAALTSRRIVVLLTDSGLPLHPAARSILDSETLVVVIPELPEFMSGSTESPGQPVGDRGQQN